MTPVDAAGAPMQQGRVMLGAVTYGRDAIKVEGIDIEFFTAQFSVSCTAHNNTSPADARQAQHSKPT